MGIEMKDYSFGTYICALRMGLGLSQFQLGNLVGVTDKAVSKWENAGAKPRLATCYRLAEVLGVSVNELLSCEQYITIPARKELDKMNRKLWKEAYENLSLYGSPPPALCWSRLAAEEATLQGTDAVQGYAVLGKIREAARAAHAVMIVDGNIGSSFAAWLFGATEVNPLPPHYVCVSCGKVEFVSDTADGFDLPPKTCSCGRPFCRDGHDIPFEGYAKSEQMGTHVVICVSEAFKPAAVKILLDFYASTAELLPVKFLDEDMEWVEERYVVLPRHKAKPKVEEDGFWHVDSEEYWHWKDDETTFTFNKSKKISEIDRLRRITGIDPPDPWELLTPQTAQALIQKECESNRDMAAAVSGEKQDFDLLLRLVSINHATGAWEENAQRLLEEGKASFREIPAAREDIFRAVSKALAQKGIRDNGLALLVMERARMGLFYSRGMERDMEDLLLSLGLPDWYPGYLKKVMYLFPKAHSTAWLQADMILEWYRVNCSEASQ